MKGYILTLSCPDKPGIVHAVTGVFAVRRHNILDLQQFSDPVSRRFFMRVHFGPQLAEETAGEGQDKKTGSNQSADQGAAADSSTGTGTGTDHLTQPLEELAARYAMQWEVRPADRKTRVLIMVSKIGHCLNDLLFRMKTGQLNIEIPLIVSNHADFAPLAASYSIPFHHLPVTKDTKPQQEAQILDLAASHAIDLVVLARYMQVLSPTFCASPYSGRIVNIHHSFLPSFKGAKPYHQAYERGVKIIGATAHFVTADLDEGPIIEQSVRRADHGMGPKELAEEGSNVESLVLATAVRWYADRRLFLNGTKTVVFS